MGESIRPLIPVEEQFRIMADSAPVLIWIANTDKLCYFFNEGWLSFTGRTQEEEYGNGWTTGVHPDDMQFCMTTYINAFDARIPFKMEYRLKRHDGEYRWLLDHGVPRYDADGTFAGYIGSCMDIDELMEAERLKKEYISRAALHDHQNLNEELAAANLELEAANEEFVAINEQLHKTQSQLAALNSELEDKVLSRTLALSQSEEETQVLNEELSSINEELAASNEELLDTNDDLQESQESLRKLVKELASSEHRTRSIVENAPFPIGVYIGREMRIEFANQSILDVWGKGNDVIGRLYSDILPELDNQQIFSQLDAVFTTGVPFHARNERVDLLVDGQNKSYYFNYSFTALRDKNGEIYGVMNTAANVSDVVLAKQKVERSEKNLHSMILQAPVAMCILLGSDHVVEVANEQMLELWGKNTDDVLGRPIFEGLPESKDQGLESLLDRVYHTGERFKASERPLSLARNGEQEMFYLDFVYEPYRNEDDTIRGIIVIINDVTEQVRSRLELERAEEMLRFSVDSANAATWYMDAETRKLVCSPRFYELLGFPPETMISYDDILKQIPEDYHEKINKAVEKSVSQGESYSMEHPLHSLDGQKRWIRALGRLYPAANNKRAHFSGLILDITEYKLDELRKNDFIAMVSHELKTPLTSMSALVQVLNTKLKNAGDPFVSGALEKANSQVRKMSIMINGFLNISRLESGKILIAKQNFNLTDLLKEIITEIELTVSSHEVQFHPGEAVLVYADRDKIGSVISNLLSNAIKYSPKGKLVVVQCQVLNNLVEVSVKDEGMGITRQDQEKLFTRYFRVEAAQTQNISGFGIGLYLSAEIIKRHNGQIWVESESGIGSTFYFSLPLTLVRHP